MRRMLAATSAIFALTIASSARANEPNEATESEPKFSLNSLEARIEALEAGALSEEKKKGVDLRTYWDNGLYFAGDGFTIKIGGRVQLDAVFWPSVDDDIDDALRMRTTPERLEDGVEFRRVRTYLSGTVHEVIDYKIQLDFASGEVSFKDVFMAYNDAGPVGKVTIGQFKEPFSLEQLTSSNHTTFMERSLADVFAPGRNVGFQIGGPIAEDVVTWNAGMFRDYDDDGEGISAGGGEYSYTGRVTALPWTDDKDFFHVGGSYTRRHPADDSFRLRQRPEIHLSSRLVDTGSLASECVDLGGVESAVVIGPFSAQAEYMMARADLMGGGDGDFSGYYVFGSYFLTEGDQRGYKKSVGAFSSVKPKHNAFDGEGGSGAIEVAVRYSMIDLDDAGVGDELSNITLGVNWYLNPISKVMMNIVRSDSDLLGEATALAFRFQTAF